MNTIFLRQTKLNNVQFRINSYLINPDRQEQIILSDSNVYEHVWKLVSNHEQMNKKSDKKNIEAREFMFTLPNELINDKEEIKSIVNQFIYEQLGSNHPYQFVVHQKAKGKTNDNLHVHLVFYEREVIQEPQPKVYKKDIWRDPTTNKLCKAGTGILVAKKGDIQKDKNGEIIYEESCFSTKDPKFKSKDFLYKSKDKLKEILNSHGFEYKVFDNQDVYLHQRKLYKGLSPQERKETLVFNQLVKDYNTSVDNLLKADSSYFDDLQEAKQELFTYQGYDFMAKIREFTLNIIQIIKDIFSDLKDDYKEEYEDDDKNGGYGV